MSKTPVIPHSRPTLSQREARAVTRVIRSGTVSQGQVVERLERSLAKRIGVKYAFAVSSGSAAIHLALLALNIEKGDAVVIPDYACAALLNCVKSVGATPILADIGDDHPNLSLSAVKNKLNARVKAVIIPHLFGQAQDLTPFKRLGVPIIEDCAQTFGLRVNGHTVGAMGHLSVSSFYATKLLCAGEGGMVATSSKRLAGKIDDLRSYDEKPSYSLRYNYKLPELSAALALSQLSQLSEFIQRRKAIAKFYNSRIRNAKFRFYCTSRDNIYYRYIVTTDKPVHKLIVPLQKKGIMAKRPLFRLLSSYMGGSALKNSQRLFKSSISLPIYPTLTGKALARIVRAVNLL